MTDPVRRHDAGLPGNGGQFAPASSVKSSTVEAELTTDQPHTSLQTDEPIRRVNLQPSSRRAREIARMVTDGMLDVAPEYQRPSVWTPLQRINLIRSWITGIPVPAIIINDRAAWPGVREDTNSPWYALVDGRQRVETAIMWFDGKIDVPASWFDPNYIATTVDTADGPYVNHHGLTAAAQAGFASEAVLPVVEAQLSSVASEAHVFGLVNTGGTEQTTETLARAAAIAAR